MELKTIDLLKLQPRFLQSDLTTMGLCAAITPEIQRLAEAVQVVNLLNLDALPEEALDELAVQYHIEFYNLDLSVELKKELIRKSIIIHRTKGTPFAMEQLLSIAFQGDATVEEWFDYSGDPFCFRIVSNSRVKGLNEILQFMKAIEITKNVRSKLDGIFFVSTADLSVPIYSRTKTENHYKLEISNNVKTWASHDALDLTWTQLDALDDTWLQWQRED